MEKDSKVWSFSNLTYEKIMEVAEEIWRERASINFLKCREYLVVGFSRIAPDNYILAITEAYQQDGKRIMIVHPGSETHNAILKLEEKLGYKFDRLRVDIAEELRKKIYIGFTDEKGNDYGTDTIQHKEG